MKTLKSIVSLVMACAALAWSAAALGQVSTVNTSCTNRLAASATQTANMGNAVHVDRHKAVALLISFQGSGADTANLTWKLGRSADSSTWETVGFTGTVAANSTTAVVAWADVPETSLAGAGWIKLLSIANANTNTLTNLTVKVVLNPNRSGR